MAKEGNYTRRATARWSGFVKRWIVATVPKAGQPYRCAWLHDVYGVHTPGRDTADFTLAGVLLYPEVYTDGIVTWSAVLEDALPKKSGSVPILDSEGYRVGYRDVTYGDMLAERLERNRATIKELKARGCVPMFHGWRVTC